MNLMLRPLLVLFVLLTVLTGLVYPLVVTGIGKLVFPNQVSGSLVMRDGKAYQAVLTPISFPGWSLVTVVPESEFLGPVQMITRRHLHS